MLLFCLVFAMSLCASVYMCFVVTCWERADLLALVCGAYSESVTFLLVSWVRCGTWLYWFLIFAPLLTFIRIIWQRTKCLSTLTYLARKRKSFFRSKAGGIRMGFKQIFRGGGALYKYGVKSAVSSAGSATSFKIIERITALMTFVCHWWCAARNAGN